MPERLSVATVAACAGLACAGFGGAYALAHDAPPQPAPAPAPPTAIRLADHPIGELRRVSALPALVVPPPRPETTTAEAAEPTPTTPAPVVEDQTPVAPAPAPTPQAPAPAPDPQPAPAPQKPPRTFDDSG